MARATAEREARERRMPFSRRETTNVVPSRRIPSESCSAVSPRVTRTAFPELDIAAIGKLIEHSPTRYRSVIAVSVLTGTRQAEALGLQWQEVDTKNGTISIRRQLTGRGTSSD
jgi:integrase